MYTLYTAPRCASFVVHALFEEAKADYRLVEIDTAKKEHKAKEYLNIDPMGQIPALDLGKGRVMTESAAIVIYVVDRYPEARLAPPPTATERPAFLRWLIFMAVNLYQTQDRAYYPERYTTESKECDGLKAAAIRQMGEQFEIIEQALSGNRYLAGTRCSAVDIYLLMVAYWHFEPDNLFRTCPKIARVCEKVRKRKVISQIGEYYKLW
jgi:glutathione S-transferase